MAIQMSDDPLPHIKQYSKVKYLPSANVYRAILTKSKQKKFAFSKIKNKSIGNVPN